MAVIHLRSPLRELAGEPQVTVDGRTVGEVIARLERVRPKLTGWVTDERGRVRSHVALFLNGERATTDASVAPADRVDVLASISGGATAEVLVGTRKGLFALRGEAGDPMEVTARRFSGQTVEYAARDPRTGTYLASVTHGQFGPRLFFSDDVTAEEWEQADGPAFPEDAGSAVERIWVVQPGEEDGVVWAGVAPAALFKSEDGGRRWHLNRPLWDVPSRERWQPGAGGLCLHSIVPWPGDASRLAVGISAAGVWLTDDGGESWRRGVQGLVPRYLPEGAREDPEEPWDLCVHKVRRTSRPQRLFLQFHGGVYRSDDAGESWIDIGSDGGLPSDFGFPMVVDPEDPDRALVIPLRGDFDRVTPEGQLRVYETRDAGDAWRPLTDGLPQDDAYATVLRQAFASDGGAGLYFGTEGGEVYGSADAGATWNPLAEHLPPVVSITVSA